MKRAFTIVELVIVIAIISILAAVLISSIVNDDERLQTVEHVPATNWNKLKQVIISSIVSVVVGGLLGALIALVIK